MISLTIEADDTVQLLAQLRQIVESGQPGRSLPPEQVAAPPGNNYALSIDVNHRTAQK